MTKGCTGAALLLCPSNCRIQTACRRTMRTSLLLASRFDSISALPRIAPIPRGKSLRQRGPLLRGDSRGSVHKREIFQKVLPLLDARRYAINLISVQNIPIHQPRETLMPSDLGDPYHHMRQYMAVALTFVDFVIRHDDLLDSKTCGYDAND